MYVRMHTSQTGRQSLILFSFLHRSEKSNIFTRKTIPITIGSNSESQKSTMKRQNRRCFGNKEMGNIKQRQQQHINIESLQGKRRKQHSERIKWVRIPSSAMPNNSLKRPDTICHKHQPNSVNLLNARVSSAQHRSLEQIDGTLQLLMHGQI